MRKQKVAVFSSSASILDDFKAVLAKEEILVTQYTSTSENEDWKGSVVFVDRSWLLQHPSKLHFLSEHALYTVLIVEEFKAAHKLPEELEKGDIDDLILTPFRSAEVLGKLRNAQLWKNSKELVAMNSTVQELVSKLEEDLRTTREIQKALIPDKFKPVHGFKVKHKYLSGLKSGGDYIDFFEFDDQTHIGILMSDSSGYGLSSAFMSVILKLAMRLSKDQISPKATIVRIFDELKLTMKENENFSVFFGILNRKTFELKYVNCGTIRFLLQNPNANGNFEEHTVNSTPLKRDSMFSLEEKKLLLQPEDRMVLFSDGVSDSFEGESDLQTCFKDALKQDLLALVNEVTFRIQSRLESEDDMPEQDCSILVLEVEKRAMRLAK